jgi:hypothetical protein
MEYLPPDPGPQDRTPVLDYARPREKGPRETPIFLRILLLCTSLLAMLLAIPCAAAGIKMIWNWWSGAVTADRNDGFRFLMIGCLFLIPGLFGIRAALRFRGL